MNYKAKLRIPKDSYAFIELDVEDSIENIKKLYDELMDIKPEGGFGLGDKEWNSVLDGFINGHPMKSEQYEKMSTKQQNIIQEVKRSLKRIKYKLK